MSKRKKKVNKNKKKKILFFIIILVVASALIILALNTNKGKDKIEDKKKVVDEIKNFDYTVSDTDTKLFKEKFNELKKALSADEIDEEEYSKIISELFVIDFFTLDNKTSKNDIGGVQFVYENYKTTFVDKARNEFYKYVKNNLNNDRKQDLPVVSTIEVDSIEDVVASTVLKTDEFKSIEKAYKVNLNWTYEEDLGYQTSATIIVVKEENDKFSVAKLSE